MSDFFQTSVYFGVLISLISYGIGIALKKKWKWGLFNPLLIAIILTIAVMLVFHIDYDVYYVPLYEQFELLKKNNKAVIAGIASGAVMGLISVFVLALIFELDHKTYVTFLPKSITTAIGMGVSQELGGYVSITVAAIIITGVLGNVFAESVCKIFRIEEPVAKGVALGTSAHAIGTSRAMEMGEIEGAMSSLSIVVAGIITVVGASIFANFI